MSPVTKPESSHWWKLGFKGCPARQNKTHLAEKDLPRTSEFKAGVKTEISCQCFGVAAVQCCCHEQQCAVWRSGATSANQETQNKNFMVTINAPFVFAVLTLHGHIPRCDYLGKYLDCQRFYNWGLKRAEVIITHGFGRQTGQDNRWESASPQLANWAWVLWAAHLNLSSSITDPPTHMHLQELPQILLLLLVWLVPKFAFVLIHVFWDHALHMGEFLTSAPALTNLTVR